MRSNYPEQFVRNRRDTLDYWKRYLPSQDISEEFESYRECVRHLWNAYLRFIDEGESFLVELDRKLVSIIALEGLPDTKKDGYYEALGVRCSPPPCGAVVLAGIFNVGSPRSEEITVNTDSADFRFIELFDFSLGPESPRDFAYIRVRVLSMPEHPQLVGTDVLVKAREAKCFVAIKDSLTDNKK